MSMAGSHNGDAEVVRSIVLTATLIVAGLFSVDSLLAQLSDEGRSESSPPADRDSADENSADENGSNQSGLQQSASGLLDQLRIPSVRFFEPASNPDLEEPVGDRIDRDAQRMVKESRGGLPAEAVPALQALMSATETSENRRAAAAALMTMARALPNNACCRSVKRQLGRRVALTNCVLNGLDRCENDAQARLLADAVALRLAIDFEQGGRQFHGANVHENLKKLEEQFPQLYELFQAEIDRNYRNQNLRISIPESAASRIMYRQTNRTEPVANCTLGAWTTGCQFTSMTTRADIIPSDTTGCWIVVCEGSVASSTNATKRPAVIATRGDHRVTLRRRMDFVGDATLMGDATANVEANNRIVGVSTKYDRVPIIRRIARKRALRKATQKLPAAENIVAGRIERAAITEFETTTADKFGQLNTMLRAGANTREKYLGQRPRYQVHSTDDALFMTSRTSSVTNFGGSEPPPYAMSNELIVVRVHESLVNGLIDLAESIAEAKANTYLQQIPLDEIDVDDVMDAVDQVRGNVSTADFVDELRQALPLIPDESLDWISREVLEVVLPESVLEFQLPGRQDGVSAAELMQQGEAAIRSLGVYEPAVGGFLQWLRWNGMPRVKFAEWDPVRIRFDENELVLVFRAGPRQDELPAVEVPFQLQVIDGSIGIDLPQLDAVIAQTEISNQPGSMLAVQILKRHRGQIRELFGDAETMLRVPIQSLVKVPDDLDFRVAKLDMTDGWLTIEVDVQLANR